MSEAPDKGGKGDEKADDKNLHEGFVPKAEHDKNIGELQQQLEDLKLEMVTPEYIEFLEGKRAPKKEEPPKDKVDLSKLTPEQIYEKVKTDLAAEQDKKLKELRDEFQSNSKESVQKEVSAFSRTHDDYEKYRPIMYGLSLEPKNKDLSLEELYNKSKEHVKGLVTTPDDKDKSRRSSNEKPGSSSNSVKKDTKYTPDSAAEEAWEEVVGKEGLPTA